LCVTTTPDIPSAELLSRTLHEERYGFSVVLLWHRRLHNDSAHRWLRELLAATAQGLRKALPVPTVLRRRAGMSV
jgi:DNA-binding transcriptional LysR family regulator